MFSGLQLVEDIIKGLKLFHIWIFLGIEDVKQRYVRTFLGPWWLVIGSTLWILTMSVVMSQLFNQPLGSYLPFIAVGMIGWGFIAGIINDSCNVFLVVSHIIHSVNLPIIVHVLRFMTKHVVIFLHNIPIILLILIVCDMKMNLNMLLVIPALFLTIVNAIWVAVLFGFLNARFRDTQQIVTISMSIIPFITPIYWDKAMLKSKQWIGDLNPFYHAIEILRSPLLGNMPNHISWIVMSFTAVVGTMLMVYTYGKFKHRVIFWL
ncbi:ABC transporter permease [Rickettsiales endosymbiont of Stachyamoeba lipophora]|uniref:ABC transporter permease n=1 Tax=Rickettsiales endosymbiont of Stachyamoeba lipophora TaxID=2486578 RepID=UPI000F6499D7|nr:ABC transporter permease [Rickettsiales endosymbiont of Stachyamoeba lipophora]AZL15825.1 hypothetical protein EF513_04605 [Rickettsiales endosymbiont of Stachyamoeba lipophora]